MAARLAASQGRRAYPLFLARPYTERMARRGTRKGGLRIFSRMWSPFKHLMMATEESTQKLGSSAGRVVKESIGAVRKVGNSFARHSNNAVRNLTRRRGGSRRGRRMSGGGTCRRGRSC
jgi:hypothetical protein